jgi:outer membrane protein assembly factor BamB
MLTLNRLVVTFCAVLAAVPVGALEIQQVWMTGRWPLETAPLVADFDQDGTEEILGVNRGGEVLRWRPDGSPLSDGPDGRATQLPEGRWTSTPAVVDAPDGRLLVFCSVEGTVLALGPDLQERWRFDLGGETVWGRATPAVAATEQGPLIAIMGPKGTLVALRPDGHPAWTAQAEEGTGGPSANAVTLRDGSVRILAPFGSGLACLSPEGQVLWSAKLEPRASDEAKRIVRSLPTLLTLPDRELILCLADPGMLAAFSTDGQLLWTYEVPGQVDATLTLYPRNDDAPLVVFTELFGNLHAVTPDGKHVWTHLFRAKNRGVPLIADADGKPGFEILLPTYDQRVLAFDGTGRLIDAVRVNGLANPTLVPLANPATGATDVFVATASLQAYRLSPSAPRSPYPLGTGEESVGLEFVAALEGQVPCLRLNNPGGRYLNVSLSMRDPWGRRTHIGALTSRSFFDLELPRFEYGVVTQLEAEATDVAGNVVARVAVDQQPLLMPVSKPAAVQSVLPLAVLHPGDSADALVIQGLYAGEADQAAFVISTASGFGSGLPGSRVRDYRVELQQPARSDGVPFGGSVEMFRVVPVGSLNGEMVNDALVPLAPANVVANSGGQPVQVWVRVDARDAEPGVYEGKVTVTALPNEKLEPELPLRIEVLPLRMPETFPLTLCTWDYVPNKWFPERAEITLDDMGRHGVNVFPRPAVPKAMVAADGALQMDFALLDAELDRLQDRGEILLQIVHPPIEFASPPSAEEQRAAEIRYLHALRDHMRARGFDYDDYAFYPVDEPGLNYEIRGVEVLLEAGALFREADPQFRIYTDPVPALSWADFLRIEPFIDVWCPNMRLVTGLLTKDPRMARIMESGKVAWSYECVSQVKSLSPLRYNRANAWRGFAFGLDGIGFWTHSQAQKDMWYPSDDEYPLVYPGDTPVPSVRWEAVRDGLEDAAAMALLRQAIKENRAAGTRADLVAQAEEALRIACNDVLQLSDAAYVESRDYLAEGDRHIWHTLADIETYARHRARIAELTLALTAKE